MRDPLPSGRGGAAVSAGGTIRALVVDDEPLARGKLRRLLAAEPDVEVVGEAPDGEAAVAAIREGAPDLVFLDVQMPHLDGFGVIEAVGAERMPVVVFVTAYDDYALRAFEVHALDYLLKPFAPRAPRQALDRGAGAGRGRRDALSPPAEPGSSACSTPSARPRPPRAPPSERLLVSAGAEREALLTVSKIDLVRADARTTWRSPRRQDPYRRRGPLPSELAARLDPAQFPPDQPLRARPPGRRPPSSSPGSTATTG